MDLFAGQQPAGVQVNGGRVKNVGAQTVYYKASRDVTTTSNDGSIAAGDSAFLDGVQFFIVGTDRTTLSITPFVASVPLPSSPSPTVAAIGDSIMAASFSGSVATAPLWFDSDIRNPVWWAQVLSKSKLQLVANGINATAGYTSAQILATHLPAVLTLSPRPGFCLILAGTNDTLETTTKANITSMCNQLAAVGIMPVLCTLPPETTPNANTNWDRVNRWIRHYGRTKGYPVVDFFALLGAVDSASNGGWATAGDTSDGIHPTSQGAKKMGQAIADTLTLYTYPNIPDVAYFNVSGDNMIGNNALMISNTAGTPTNWTNNAAAGATFSVAADANIRGNYATVLRASADAYIQSAYMTFVPGRRYAIGWAMKSTVEASSSNAGIFLNNLSGSFNIVGFNDCRKDIASGTLFSMELDWPSGLDNNQAAIFVRAKGSAGSSISIGQAYVYDLTTLGLV